MGVEACPSCHRARVSVHPVQVYRKANTERQTKFHRQPWYIGINEEKKDRKNTIYCFSYNNKIYSVVIKNRITTMIELLVSASF